MDDVFICVCVFVCHVWRGASSNSTGVLVLFFSRFCTRTASFQMASNHRHGYVRSTSRKSSIAAWSIAWKYITGLILRNDFFRFFSTDFRLKQISIYFKRWHLRSRACPRCCWSAWVCGRRRLFASIVHLSPDYPDECTSVWASPDRLYRLPSSD